MTLATTIANPVVRGPVPLAKTLGAIERLSGGRLVVAVGPGSSPADYAAVGLDFDERWQRLDEAVMALRALLRADAEPFVARYYPIGDVTLEPRPVRPDGPPIWVGSWGSAAGLRRVARLADGWLASAYNTTPASFATAWAALQELLRARGKDPATFPNGLATMWFHITDDRAEADRIVRERAVPGIHRSEDELRERPAFGPPDLFAEKLSAFARAGVQRVFIWPVADEEAQLELFATKVRPLITS